MARVAIVSYDVQTVSGKAGGVAAFTTRWAQLLQQAGEDVTIVMVSISWEPARVDPHWRARYQSSGISLIEIQTPPPLPTRWPEVPTMRLSELAAPVLRGFDVVYLQDWGNAAFQLIRERRYSAASSPICVTVLHGPSEWELSSNGKFPELPRDLHVAYQERYAAKHSDYVVSPSRYMVAHLKSLDWEFPGEVSVLGLPMPDRAREETRLPTIRTIVYFGRLEERKGIRNFVKALQHITERPKVVLLGAAVDKELLTFALREIEKAGFSVTHHGALDRDEAFQFLRGITNEALCVIPSPSDNHPYSVVEASLIPGLNVIACRAGGVPEILQDADAQLCSPLPRDLAAKIAERLKTPLEASHLARYDCAAANQRWLEFHRGLVRKPAAQSSSQPTVDICITYYQKAPYLGQLVTALENQTGRDFHVIAVNDGSPDEESNRVFEQYAKKASAKGWDFYCQPNAFVDAARNSAARRGIGELILFIDSDDVPAPNAVARMREAMARSGDDALICASYLFTSGEPPCDPVTGEIQQPAFATCIPLGMDLVGGLVNPCAFGGSMFIVKRSVFEEMGGFTEIRGAGHEDWEFYVRMALAGYKVDILPEMLQFYRQVEGSLARTLPSEASKLRLLGAYEDALGKAGLKGAALALAGLHQSGKEAELTARKLWTKSCAPKSRFAFFSGATNSFETESSALGWLRNFYREKVSLDARLKFHRIFLAPFFGPYLPPNPE